MREKHLSAVPPEYLGGSVDLHESITVRAMTEAWDKFLSIFEKAVELPPRCPGLVACSYIPN